MLVQPLQQGAHTATSESDAGIYRAIIHMKRVATGREGVAARIDFLARIAALFVRFFRAEDPFIVALETVLQCVQIKRCESPLCVGYGVCLPLSSFAIPAVKPGLYDLREDHVARQHERQQQPVQRRKRDKSERVASGDTVSHAPTATMMMDVAINGQLARLWMNGILLVRMT